MEPSTNICVIREIECIYLALMQKGFEGGKKLLVHITRNEYIVMNKNKGNFDLKICLGFETALLHCMVKFVAYSKIREGILLDPISFKIGEKLNRGNGELFITSLFISLSNSGDYW